MTQVPWVTDGLLQGAAAGRAAGLAVGSPAWFAWLTGDAARSFSYGSPEGAYTAQGARSTPVYGRSGRWPIWRRTMRPFAAWPASAWARPRLRWASSTGPNRPSRTRQRPRELGNAPPLMLLASLPVVRLRLAQGDAAAAGAVLAEVRPLIQHGPFAMVAQLLEAAEARVRLALGEGAAAPRWQL